MEHDPVCGTTIRPGLEAANANFQGQMYHFCSVECRDLFRRDPMRYIQGATSKEQNTNPLRGVVLPAEIFTERATP